VIKRKKVKRVSVVIEKNRTLDAKRKLAMELSDRIAGRTQELGLTSEQLEQSAAEEIRAYRNERRNRRSDRR